MEHHLLQPRLECSSDVVVPRGRVPELFDVLAVIAFGISVFLYGF